MFDKTLSLRCSPRKVKRKTDVCVHTYVYVCTYICTCTTYHRELIVVPGDNILTGMCNISELRDKIKTRRRVEAARGANQTVKEHRQCSHSCVPDIADPARQQQGTTISDIHAGHTDGPASCLEVKPRVVNRERCNRRRPHEMRSGDGV